MSKNEDLIIEQQTHCCFIFTVKIAYKFLRIQHLIAILKEGVEDVKC
jgi:hypothetical protein